MAADPGQIEKVTEYLRQGCRPANDEEDRRGKGHGHYKGTGNNRSSEECRPQQARITSPKIT